MTQTSPLAAPALDDLASLRASYRERKQALLTELGDSGNRMRGMNHVLGQLARLTDEVLMARLLEAEERGVDRVLRFQVMAAAWKAAMRSARRCTSAGVSLPSASSLSKRSA